MTRMDPFGWAGSVIDGQFSVDALIGEGAFGVVYRGTHLGFEAPIAIKCLKIPSDLAGDKRERFLSRFRDEGRLLHRLSRLTTGVVQALHIGAATAPSGSWTPYIVMEWLEGETLAAELRRRDALGRGPRGVDEAIEVLSPAAEALVIAHHENVSHRDVKPENLFLVRGRSGSSMKVLDFGIAKVFTETPSSTAALVQAGESLRAFTPRYAAPEQFSPRYGATGPWTDVFAMALVLIEVASGRPALTGSDLLELLSASGDEHHRPSLSGSGVAASPALEGVLERALAVSPALRFPDLGAMWAAVLGAQKAPKSAAISGRTFDAVADDPGFGSSTTVTFDGVSTGENRVCTVMFVDLSDVIGLSARLDAEEVKEITGRCAHAVWEQVQRMDGVVESPGGGRVMAVFGLPRATDSDAERAVVAALLIQAEIARVSVPRAFRPARLSARISVTTGRVFAETAGDATRHELGVIGAAVHDAARLLRRAPRGAVVIGRDTFRLVAGRFHVSPLAPVEPPESGGALPAYRVLAPIALRHGLPSADFHGIETALQGRGAERQRLIEALETVLSEQRATLVTLVGPPGVGRSRLLADVSATLIGRREALFTIAVQCSPLDKDTSYSLAASLIRKSFQIDEEDTAEAALRKLRGGVRWFRAARRRIRGPGVSRDLDRADLDDVLAQIAAVLGVCPADRTDAVTSEEASGLVKHRIAAAVISLLGLVATRLPIAFLCDDIQWADDASLDLLEAITARAGELPILIVCSARPEFDELRPRWGASQAAPERVDIAPLPRRYIEEMIRDRLRLAGQLSPELVRTLADRAEGNPLTLVETLHLLVDAGIVEVAREGPWRVHQERLGALALPATIQGIVQARLDRLDPAARDVLERAAVIGRTFWEGAIDRLRRDGGRASPGQTEALLVELRERQLIRAREPSTFPDEREYVFAESATHEVAYEVLSAKLRRSLHLLVADWLKARPQGHAGAALLALHYDRGGDLARAAAEYARAGAQAAALGENAEALRLLVRARQIHDESEEIDPADGAAAPIEDRRVAPWIDRVRLRIELGDVLRRVGRLDEAERTYNEARTRILRVERRGTASQDGVEAPRWDARTDFHLAHVHRLRGATAEARSLVERAIRRAGEGDAAGDTPPMYAMLAFLHRRERHPDATFQAALQGLRVCRAAGHRDERWREDVAQILFAIGTALYDRGRMAGAERSYRQALRALSDTKQPHLAGVALNGIAAARIARGDLRGARDLFARSLQLKERVGDLHPISVAHNNLAEVELRLGDVPAALEHARQSVRLGEQVRAGYDLADFYRNLAEASLAAGDIESALDAGRKALGIAETRGRVSLGDVAVTLARVCAHAVQGGARGEGAACPDPEPRISTGAARADLRTRAVEAAEVLSRSLSKHFEDPRLRKKADECRALLARVLVDAPITPAA